MDELTRLTSQLTREQVRMFFRSVRDAGINTRPWWDAVPYSGAPKVLHWGLFKKCRWFFKLLGAVFKSRDDDDPYTLGKLLIAAHDDSHTLEQLARYIRHKGWTLSCEMGQWQLSHGDFVIRERYAFRGGDRQPVVDLLRNFGIEQGLIDRALDHQTEEIQAYVLSSTEQEARALAQIIEEGSRMPISPEEYAWLCRRLKEVAEELVPSH